MADVLLERLGTQGALAGGDALLEQLPLLLGARCRLLGENQVGVGAIEPRS